MWGYPRYVSVTEKKEKAAKQLTKLKKKNSNLNPIVIQGSKIAKTWWGMAWNKNLESYADYSNRIARGRSYVKNGFVFDLQIEKSTVKALVSGSGSKPYSVTVKIEPLETGKWDSIVKACGNKIGSIEELTEGKFPKELEGIFSLKGKGLFPSPKEIAFSCSCPDGAYMCKHVAAVLYGIGARFDEDPVLFFTLREIDVEQLLKKSVEEKMKSMLKNADKKTERVMADVDVGKLFGV